MSKTVERLTSLVESFAADEEKFEKGNQSAGRRGRQTLQLIKKACSDRRKEMMAKKE